ncbi:AAA family ATPase [Gracilibacillus alcaliphilus]|uniref:AAA family ATPase n=1 Tax=Gracilibacillus alcaliphilus TaxID=1401441 RepID=UPI00195A512B|nr:AAA family ATPase [Gracilibacillus alcaliphilus]MBM7675400.1 uncharacterized protein YhaN [Gracilibacillus alcaliphilus]
MRIEQVDIYGFGKWVDKSFSFQSEKYLEIAGDNEAGKSTIREFILYILFGLKPKSLERFVPRKGSTLGGRLIISGLDKEPVTIERIYRQKQSQAVITTSDGQSLDEYWLKNQLQGLDRDQYGSIYAFTAHDLQQIQDLDNQALHEVLLAIGMTGSDRIYQVEKQLHKEMDALFKPYGKKPLINQQFQVLADTQQQLQEAKRLEQTYQSQLDAIAEGEANLQQLHQQKGIQEQELKQLEKQLTNYSLINDYYLTCAQLKRYADEIAFPTAGAERLKEWKDKLLPIQSKVQVLRKEIEHIKEQTSQINLVSAEQVAEWEKAAADQQRLYEQQQHVQQLEERIADNQAEISTILASLQLGISEEELAELELPFYLENEWSDLRDQLDKLQVEQQYLLNDQQSVIRVRKELKEKKRHLMSQQLDQGHIQHLQEQIQTAQSTEQTKRQIEKFQEWQETYQKQLRISLIVGGIGWLCAFILFFVTDFIWSGIIIGLATIQYVAFRLYGKTITQWQQSDANESAVSHLTPDKVREIDQQLQKQDELYSALEALEKDLQRYQIDELKLNERITFIEERLAQLQQRINDYKAEFPFLAAIPFTYWPKLYPQFKSLKGLADKNRELRKKRTDVIRTMSEIKNIEGLDQRLKQEQQKRQQKKQLKERCQTIEQQLALLIEEQRPYQQEVQHLLAEAQAKTETDFWEKAAMFEEYVQLKQQQERLYDSLRVSFDQQMIQCISQGKFEEEQSLQKQRTALQQSLIELEEQIKLQQAAISDEKAKIAMLEANEETSIQQHRLAQQQDQLQEQVRQWTVYQVAFRKLSMAKVNYTKKYLPKVLELASVYFQRLTLGHYVNLRMMEDQTLTVETKTGYLFQVTDLSQATMDQLYISIRFALSQIMTDRIALPFLIDDGFVHFDPSRKAVILEIMEELSREHQIIYFTANATAHSVIQL